MATACICAPGLSAILGFLANISATVQPDHMAISAHFVGLFGADSGDHTTTRRSVTTMVCWTCWGAGTFAGADVLGGVAECAQ